MAAVRDGVVVETTNTSGGTVAIRVNVGTAADPVYETDFYLHLNNMPAAIKATR